MLDYVLNHPLEIIAAIGSVITAASAIAAMTPTPVDDGVLLVLRKLVDFLALNVGHAKKP